MRVLCVFAVLAVRAMGQVEGFSDLLSYLNRCRSGQFDRCLAEDLKNTIDDIMSRNETYRLNHYLTVTTNGRPSKNRFAVTDGLSTRLTTFFQTLKLNYHPQTTDDEQPRYTVVESRKKKDKGGKSKMGMMMAVGAMCMSAIGGMMNMGMMGGVSMIAMKALIIAKFAFLLAAVIALKKLFGNSGGGAVQQPVVWSGGGGGSEHSGYHRSFNPTDTQNIVASSLAYRDQINTNL
ncbi:uncharacterized protein LOC126843022 [Adelges cooleyi]|uniref:uncharacterized protein LOC126843022 n=1 Tax=Adelges cooleyi TaxID=133065 RepID=UPI00217F7E16|nr:uncharacterized protein LOC126843022 [Adelges cooleyi]